MNDINTVTFSGTLCRDPKEFGKDGGNAELRVAIDNSFKENKKTAYVDVVTFGAQAKFILGNMTKGTRVLVNGRIDMDEWEKDGKKYSKIKFVANNVLFRDKKATRNAEEEEQVVPPSPGHDLI